MINKHTDDTQHYNINIKELVFTLARYKEVLIACVVSSFILMLAFLMAQTPIYKSVAQIQIDVKGNKVVNFDSVVSGMSSDELAIQSEIDVLTSRHLASNVVDKLSLVGDKEFNEDHGKSKQSWLAKLFFDEEPLSEEEKEIMKIKTVNKFLENLSINRNPRSYTIAIEFTSEDSKKAALIANTVVSEYLVNQLSSKFDATKLANEWLNNKINSLQKQLYESEMAVQTFREENDLMEADGMTINDQQLSELNTQLILASTERAQAEARLQSARNSTGSTSEVLSSVLIQNLHEQEAEVRRKKSDLSSRYGKRHPKIINVDSELRDLRDKIESEVTKVKQSLQKEVEIARVREDSLRNNLGALKGIAGSSGKAKVQLDELLRQRDANRSLYESFLLRSKETFYNKDLKQNDAKIISSASNPLEPSYPRKKLMLLLSIIIGGGIGVVVVFLIEHLDNAFKNLDQVEKITGISAIGTVPKIEGGKGLIDHVIKKPSSEVAEYLRSILTAIYFSNPDKKPKSIAITSSVPNEGKTNVTISLAAIIAKSGQKVLVIDCDLKRPSVAKEFGLKDVEFGLENYLTKEATREQIINIDKKSNIHFVASHSNISNSQNLLSSEGMKDFIKEMSEEYDVVLLDSPPMMVTSDPIILSSIAETVAFVIKWNETPRHIVVEALNKIQQNDGIKIAGAILSMVNMEQFSKHSYGGDYSYGNYKDYYLGSK